MSCDSSAIIHRILSHPCNNVRKRITHLVSRLRSRNTERQQNGGLEMFGQLQQVVNQCSIKVADPTSTEASFGSCQADVFGSNADIDDAVGMTIGRTNPFVAMIYADDNNRRCRLEPIARIRLTYQRKCIGRLTDIEVPWLTIASRGCNASTLENVLKVVLADLFRGVATHAVTRLAEMEKIVHRR